MKKSCANEPKNLPTTPSPLLVLTNILISRSRETPQQFCLCMTQMTLLENTWDAFFHFYLKFTSNLQVKVSDMLVSTIVIAL